MTGGKHSGSRHAGRGSEEHGQSDRREEREFEEFFRTQKLILHELRETNATLKLILAVLREKPKPTITGRFGTPRPGTTA